MIMNNKGESKEGFIIDDQHPYAGLFAFREEDRDYFFGREREINTLTKLIDKKVLTVLFGKSGVGKTSLLRAGLIPRLRSNYYLPIFLRINFDDCEKPAIIQVKETIESIISQVDPPAVPFEDKTLWEYFSAVKIFKGVVKPILVFDQFEEIFRPYDEDRPNVDTFVTEIADLIENRVPVTVQERLKREKKKLDPSDQAFNLRVIFSLREDYLPQLETIYHYIPSVRYSRFRASQMQGIDAIEAVIKPAKKILKDRDVAVEIIKKVPGAKDPDYNPFETIEQSWETKKIEPFLLSLFCYQVNKKRLEKDKTEISGDLIQEMNTQDIMKDFYEENVRDFKSYVKIAIEDLLVTPEGYRKLQDKNSLMDYAVTDIAIEELVNRRIIRKEERNRIEYVELIHDVLAPILKDSRDKRKEEERRKKEAAIRKKRNRRFITAITAVVLFIMAVLMGVTLEQKAKIKRQEQKAEEEKQRTEEERQKRLAYEWAAYSIDLQEKDRQLSFRLAESAYNMEKTNLVAYRALLNVFYKGGFYTEVFKSEGTEFSETTSKKSDFFSALSPDGKQILTVTSKKAILWNWKDQQVDKHREITLPGELEFRPNAAFSADGAYVAFCTNSDEQVILWNLNQNESTPLTLEGGVNSLAFSPDKNSKNIITASRDKKVRLFDLTGKLIREFTGHSDHVNSAAFSPDGKFIISAGWDKTVRLWDLDGNLIGKPFSDNKDGVNTAAFSPDGHQVVTAGVDGSIRLWNFREDKSRTLGEHKGGVTSAVFSPDGQYILTGSEDKTVRLLTLNNFLVIEFKDIKDIVHSVSFSPDGKNILIAPARGPAQLRLIDPEEIIRLVNIKGIVPQVTEDEKNTYNLHHKNQVQAPPVIE